MGADPTLGLRKKIRQPWKALRLRTTRNCASETLHRRYGLPWEPPERRIHAAPPRPGPTARLIPAFRGHANVVQRSAPDRLQENFSL